MKVLFFGWGELTKEDAIESLRQIADVSVVEYPIMKLTQTEEIEALLKKEFEASSFDYIFSFNFFPGVAKFSYFHRIPYIAYVYDSPHQFLYNEWVYNPYNYIFLFDSAQVEELTKKGLGHVYYLPLPINRERMKKLSNSPICYKHDVSFMGSLYADSRDFFAKIKGVKADTKKRLDACIEEQQKEPGVNIIDKELDEALLEELTSLVTMDLRSEYHLTKEEMMKHSIYRTCTAKERTNLIKKVAEKFVIALFTFSDTSALKGNLNIKLCGSLEYMTTMPQTFRNSKINLNISLRGIKTGIPLRCIDILGAGGFLITNYQSDLEKHFENKKDLVWYHSPEELMELIEYYLTHEKEREEIAANGHKKVRSLFSYEKQFSTIFDIVHKNPVIERNKSDIPISVCLIGKNEEQHVDACLKPWFDLGVEIIVADTGSTDKTMTLSRKYTNNVFFRPWTNHFAEARNNAVKWARNPYVLAIDFDEYLMDIDLEEVKKACAPNHIGMISCQTPNLNGLKDQTMIKQIARLFHKDICHYEGRAWELVCSKAEAEIDYIAVPITLEHKGYMTDTDMEEKTIRNLKLLMLDLDEGGKNPYIYYQIGQSYRILNDLERALEYYNLALSMEVDPELEYVQSLVEAYGFCLLEKKDIETALQLENIYEEFSKRADFVFLMGLIYMNAALFEDAIVQFEKATTIDDFATIGTNSFLAWYNAGVICEVCGLAGESLEYYHKCKNYEPALKRIEALSTGQQ